MKNCIDKSLPLEIALFYLHKRDRTTHSDLTNLCFIVCYLVKTEYRLGSEFSIFYILSAKSKGYSGIKIVPLAKTMGGEKKKRFL